MCVPQIIAKKTAGLNVSWSNILEPQSAMENLKGNHDAKNYHQRYNDYAFSGSGSLVAIPQVLSCSSLLVFCGLETK